MNVWDYWAWVFVVFPSLCTLAFIGYRQIPMLPKAPPKLIDHRTLEEKIQAVVDARGGNGRLIAERRKLLMWQHKFDLEVNGHITVTHKGGLTHSSNETCYICERNDNGKST